METERLDQVQRQLKGSIYLNSPAVIARRFTECKWYRVNPLVVEYEVATLKGSNGEKVSQLKLIYPIGLPNTVLCVLVTGNPHPLKAEPPNSKSAERRDGFP